MASKRVDNERITIGVGMPERMLAELQRRAGSLSLSVGAYCWRVIRQCWEEGARFVEAVTGLPRQAVVFEQDICIGVYPTG